MKNSPQKTAPEQDSAGLDKRGNQRRRRGPPERRNADRAGEELNPRRNEESIDRRKS